MDDTQLEDLRRRLGTALAGPHGEVIRAEPRKHELSSYGLTIGELEELRALEEVLKPLYAP